MKVACWIAMLSGAGVLSVRGADPAGKPVAPDANLSASLTNISRLAPKKDGLKQLEEELSRSLQPFSPRGALDALLVPQFTLPPASPPAMPGRRLKRDGQRGGWSFDKLDDSGNLNSDLFGSGASQGGQGSFEQLYNSLGQQSGTGSGSRKKNTSAAGSDRQSFDDLDKEDSRLPGGLRESAKKLRDKLLGGDSMFNQGSSRSPLSDLFAPDRNVLSRDEIQAHKEYMGRYREMLDGPAQKPGLPQNPFGSVLDAGTSQSTPSYLTPNPLSPSTLRDSVASTPAGAESVFRPHALPELNNRALNQWNPLYAAPTIEQSKPVPFAAPVAEAPRRRF